MGWLNLAFFILWLAVIEKSYRRDQRRQRQIRALRDRIEGIRRTDG